METVTSAVVGTFAASRWITTSSPLAVRHRESSCRRDARPRRWRRQGRCRLLPAPPKCSGRTPTMTLLPVSGAAPANGCVMRVRSWPASSTVTLRVLRPTTRPLMKFICGEPMKPATNTIVGLVVELDRRAQLLDMAGAQHDDAVGERHRLDLVVGDIDHGGAELAGAAWRSRRASGRAARRRDWRAARRTGTPCGSRTMARPMATRWRWPPESWRRPAVEQIRSICRMSAAASTRALDLSALGMPPMRSPKARFCSTVICG